MPDELLIQKRWFRYAIFDKLKLPIDNSNRPTAITLSDCQTFDAIYNQRQGAGLAFYLKGSNYTVIDIDDCLLNQKLKNNVRHFIDHFDTYIEYSISLTGLHVLYNGIDELSNRSWQQMFAYRGQLLGHVLSGRHDCYACMSDIALYDKSINTVDSTAIERLMKDIT